MNEQESMDGRSLSLARLIQIMSDSGVRHLYAKVLAANDNSKNQPYFGGSFEVLNILPSQTARPAGSGSGKGIFKAPLNFAWLDDAGRAYAAPNAKLILYPQYPEVRFSGYLQGCEKGPSSLMGTNRTPGRILFLGVRDDGSILGYATGPDSPLARQLHALEPLESAGVFLEVPLRHAAGEDSDRTALLTELCRIAQYGWIPSKRLDTTGTTHACNAPNCGGYTLEAELGITPNGIADPDFRGWEVKQYAVNDFYRFQGGAVTLMTPEPTAGVYADASVVEFVKRYGYPDTLGRPDRRNFGGIHRAYRVCERTGLTLQLVGYDYSSGKITDLSAGIALTDENGTHAAVWRYVDLIDHWKRKHARAVYVPSQSRSTPQREYRYARHVALGVGTDFLRFLAAMAKGRVYYDPGIKVEKYSTSRPVTKRRSQFRIKVQDLSSLYHSMERVDACGDS